MEESPPLETLTFFIRSNEVQELRVEIFDSSDSFITGLTLLNYSTHTIHLQQRLTHFYCTIISPQLRIQEQMEVKIAEEPQVFGPIEVARKFRAFSLTLKIDIAKTQQIPFLSCNLLREQNELAKFVTGHLRKLEKNVLKKIELEELKKPFKELNRSKKSGSLRKMKSRLNFTTLTRLPSNNEKKTNGKKPEDLKSTLKSLEKGKYKMTDQSQQSQESVKLNAQATQKSKKHNTLFENNPICHTELSSKDCQEKEAEKQRTDLSYISQFLLAMLPTMTDKQKIKLNRSKKTRLARLSHNEELEKTTLEDIGKQKKALEVVRTMSGLYSQQVSPIKKEETSVPKIRKKASPYFLVNSRAFIKRKVK